MKLTRKFAVAILLCKCAWLLGLNPNSEMPADTIVKKRIPLYIWASLGSGSYIDNQPEFTGRFRYTNFNTFSQLQLSARYRDFGLAFIYAERQIHSAGKLCNSNENTVVGFYHYQYARFHFQAEGGLGKANFCYNGPYFSEPEAPTNFVSNVTIFHYGSQIMYSFSPYFGISFKYQVQLNRISAQRGVQAGISVGLIRDKRPG